MHRVLSHYVCAKHRLIYKATRREYQSAEMVLNNQILQSPETAEVEKMAEWQVRWQVCSIITGVLKGGFNPLLAHPSGTLVRAR